MRSGREGAIGVKGCNKEGNVLKQPGTGDKEARRDRRDWKRWRQLQGGHISGQARVEARVKARVGGRMVLSDNPGIAMALPDKADPALPEAGMKAGTK